MTGTELLINFFATYLILVFILVGAWLLRRGDWITLINALLGGLTAFTISSFIKHFFYLPRPFILTGQLPLINFRLDGSLPSGHTALAFAISLAVLSRYRKIGLLLLCVSILIAFGRIAGGVHTLVDVSVGLLVGLFSFLITQRLLRD